MIPENLVPPVIRDENKERKKVRLGKLSVMAAVGDVIIHVNDKGTWRCERTENGWSITKHEPK
jgi:hypothetical protein